MAATDENSVATWHHEGKAIALAAVWTEKKHGRGEDAPPTGLFHAGSGRGIIAVYDGMGGAGGRAVGRTPDEVEVSGAFVGARAARFALEEWFVAAVSARRTGESAELREALLDGLYRTGIAPGKSRGTMVRHLPTTLAAIEYEVRKDRIQLAARWAGDSRAYILHRDAGLCAISRDDTADSDALILLANDQPMTNVVCADREFHVNDYFGAGPRSLPILLVCATDGFYNYVQTPAHFEYLLLRTMSEADSLAAWASSLAKQVQEYTSDDASLAIAVPGYRGGYRAMQKTYKERLEFLFGHYIRPFAQVAGSDDEPAIAVLREEQWARYRGDYEMWIRQMEASR